jgi:serine/threonine protein kinase
MPALDPRTPTTRATGDEPLPGYRLVFPLGRGGFGEVWKCVAPGGLPKAIKFVPDDAPGADSSLEQEYEAFLRVKGIRHPFLLTLERVELIGGELVTVMELADQSLAQRYDECRTKGLAGIPRAELLAYMVDAAEALDVLGRDHGLQHLDVKPANLFLLGGHAKVGDYGLVARYLPGKSGAEPQLGRGLTPRYVAPEILAGRVDSHSDQYSLALVYQELLTGSFPYPGPTVPHYLDQHRTAEPDLSALPPTDREPVKRALSKTPAHRFPGCLAFVRELMRETSTPPPVGRSSTTFSMAALTRTGPPLAARRDPASTSIKCSLTLRGGGADELARMCPGYRLTGELTPDARGRHGRGTDPTGVAVRVHLLRLDGGATADLEHTLWAVAESHPRLWQTVFAPHPRTVAVVTPDAARPVCDWLAGKPPLRPGEAADQLAPVAEVLDELSLRTRVPHLLVSSTTVVVQDGQFGLTGYGPGELLRLSRADADWLADDPFAAPEAASKPTAASDQYSLALVFLELVGGWPAGKGPPKDRRKIDWTSVPAAKREAVLKALATDPADRFESCAAFLAAVRPPAPIGVVLDDVRPIESVARLRGEPADPAPLPSPKELSERVLAAAVAATVAGGHPDAGTKPLTLPDGRVSIRFPIKWTAGLRDLKAAAFCDQHGYTVTPMASDTSLFKPKPRTIERGMAVELVVRWPVLAAAGMAEVTAVGRYTVGREPLRGVDQVTAALDQFRRTVQNADDRRKVPRVRAEFPVTVYPVTDELQIGEPISGRCRDVSATGFSAVLTAAVPTGHAFVSFQVPDADRAAVLVHLVRAIPSDGVLVAGRFVFAGDGR